MNKPNYRIYDRTGSRQATGSKATGNTFKTREKSADALALQFVQRLALPLLWAEYGEGPPKRGDYNIRVRSKDGREKTIRAWHNPGNGHWLADGKECGYVDIITPPGETEEWRITHWQNRKPKKDQHIISTH